MCELRNRIITLGHDWAPQLLLLKCHTVFKDGCWYCAAACHLLAGSTIMYTLPYKHSWSGFFCKTIGGDFGRLCWITYWPESCNTL